MRGVGVVVCLFAGLAVTGCAARRSATPAATMSVATAPARGSLETFMAEVRRATERARPARSTATTVEGQDTRLAAALAAAQAWPSAEALRGVASEYRRLRVMDRALEYLDRALLADEHDAATYDERARTWRDAGFPARALGDAHRAVYFDPQSAPARNTLGTVLQALGRRADALEQYAAALAIDPQAAYALNNICYASILDGRAQTGMDACRQALRLDPTLRAARNNLGVGYAAANQIDSARAQFEQAGDRASALYNLGVMHMARRDYAPAVVAFAAAQQVRPSLHAAGRRVRQAQQLLAAGGDR